MSHLIAAKVLAQFGVTPDNATFKPLAPERALESWVRGEVDTVRSDAKLQDQTFAAIKCDIAP